MYTNKNNNKNNKMVSNETTVKVSKWLIKEVEKFINKNDRNKTEFPSKRNFVDRAIMILLEEKGIDLGK